MNYEQKYKDALDAAKHIYNNMRSGGNFGGMEDLEVIFPELRESEDERMINEIIHTVTGYHPIHTTEEIDSMVAYLEKQKEQKPAEWNEDDELMRKRCIVDLGYLTEYEPQYKERYDAQINWLKSLRPSWKPSEDDLDAFKELIDDANKRGWVTPGASRLYEQLKAL